MKIFAFLLLVQWTYAQQCMDNGAVCITYNTFAHCGEGVVPTEAELQCPQGLVCTGKPEICSPNCGDNPTPPEVPSACGDCTQSENHLFACDGETQFRLCYGRDTPDDNSKASCAEGYFCDVTNPKICTAITEESQPSCVRDSGLPEFGDGETPTMCPETTAPTDETTTPEDTTPGETTSDDTTPGETPDDTTSGETTSEETTTEDGPSIPTDCTEADYNEACELSPDETRIVNPCAHPKCSFDYIRCSGDPGSRVGRLTTCTNQYYNDDGKNCVDQFEEICVDVFCTDENPKLPQGDCSPAYLECTRDEITGNWSVEAKQCALMQMFDYSSQSCIADTC